MTSFAVNIVGGATQDQSSASGQGSYQEVISDDNKQRFNLSDDSTMKGFVANSFGARPDDLYLCSPTPWGDLYQTYGWPQVQTQLQFVSAAITGFNTQLEAVNTVTLTNNTSTPATFKADMTRTVTNQTSTTWTSNDSISIGQKFSYALKFLGTGGGGETSFNYTHSWGESTSESNSVTLGTNAGVSVLLQPGQTVYVDLMAYVGTMTVDVTYNASLSGCMAVNYDGTYRDHHFWCLDVNKVLSDNSKPTSANIVQHITVQYYTAQSVVLRDPKNSSSTQTLWSADAFPAPDGSSPTGSQPAPTQAQTAN